MFTGTLTSYGIQTASSFTATSSIASIFPYASTTAITVSGVASTTALTVSSLNTANCDVKADAQGVFSCGTDAVGAGGSSASKWATSTTNTASIYFTGLGNVGIGTSSPVAVLSASSTSETTATAVFDQRSTGGLLTLQQAGVDRLAVQNGGGILVTAATTDIVRTKTADFNAGTLTNVSASNDEVGINPGTISGDGTINATTTQTNVGIGPGAQVILRSDGKYVIIHGGSSATASLWDGRVGGTMTAMAKNVASGGSVGAGAIALKQPDGKYRIIQGGSSAGLNTIFDPWDVVATANGPTGGSGACAGVAIATGTNAVLRDDGRYQIFCGGFNSTSVFDPTANTFTAGPTLSSGTFGAGSMALRRDDGTFLVFPGNGTTATFIFNPYNSTTNIGSLTSVTPTGPLPTVGTSTVVIRRQDGKFLIIPGASGTSYIYNPVSTTASPSGSFLSTGVGPTATMDEGAQAVWRQDGKYTLFLATSTTINIIDPGAGSQMPVFSAPSPSITLGGNAGYGFTAFMLQNGNYALLRGGGTKTIDLYDTSYVRGGNTSGVELASYESECVTNTNINEGSTLNWSANSEGSMTFQVKMGVGSCSGSYIDIGKSGDLIGAASTTNSVQVKVFFKKDLPVFLDQEWGIRKAGLVRYRRINKDPTLYDISIDNGAVLHRTQFDLGNIVATTTASTSNDASGPSMVNLTNDKDRNLGMALATGVGYGTTLNSTNDVYNGAMGSNINLLTATASSTLVIKRPDEKFVIISGNSTANAMLYDQTTASTTALGTTPTVTIGTGALAFKRPDGKFLIVAGKSSTVTNIYDPVSNNFVAGPALTGLVGDGSVMIPLPTGRVLIVHGNYLRTSSIYDPIQNVIVEGPQPSAVVGAGSMAIPRPDGTYYFIPGMATAACTALSTVGNFFDPYTMIFTTSGAPSPTGNGPGAFTFQRSDGEWVIVRGGATATSCIGIANTQIYNPASNVLITGPSLTASVGRGAHAIPRPDGNWLLVQGGGGAAYAAQNTTSIYMEKKGAFTAEGQNAIGQFVAGPLWLTGTGPNSGAVSFQRNDGKFVTIIGAATTTTGSTVQQYDAGWVSQGYYRSEQFDMGPVNTKLDSNSTLVWKTNGVRGISAEVRTAATQAALGTSTTREIPTSGSLINPAAGDKWLSINFNFKRSFPTFSGILSDVYIGGGSLAYQIKQVDTPILYEYKVTKDKDLINLQADGLSMFRVSSNGDVYTQVGATINTSGADLAERYTSQTSLNKGEIVSIDPYNNHSVRRTMYQYQPDAIGIVSTDPGFVAGAYTEDSYPIALVGRVPLMVSTENGMIHAGDAITPSSVPGHGMKAKLAGRIIATALESLDPNKLTECPPSDFNIPNRKCGMVMAFVNIMDFSGTPVEIAMSDWLAETETSNVNDSESGKLASEVGLIIGNTRSNKILDFLTHLKSERSNGMASKSEIFADRISAVSGIISPEILANVISAKEVSGLTMNSVKTNTQEVNIDSPFSSVGGFTMKVIDGKLTITGDQADIVDENASTTLATTTKPMITFDSLGNAFFAGELRADKLVANSIVGIDIAAVNYSRLSDDISTLEASTSELVASSTAGILGTLNKAITTDGLIVSGIASTTELRTLRLSTIEMNISSITTASTSGLTINGKLKITDGLTVDQIGSNKDVISLMNDVEFFGRPYFTTDTAGFAIVKSGSRTVEVLFDKEYLEQPIVTADISIDNATDTEMTASLADAIFSNDVKYVITNKSSHGFTILLNKKVKNDIQFSWMAIAVKGAKRFESKKETIEEIIPKIPDEVIATSTPEIATTTVEVLPIKEILPEPKDEVVATTTVEKPELEVILPEVVPEIVPEVIHDEPEVVVPEETPDAGI